jgi:hypothetical protein
MGGGGTTITMPAPDNSAILALINQMEQEQADARAAAEKAQKEAMITAQDQAAALSKKQGEFSAAQNLSRLEQVGAMKDAQALQKQQEQAFAAGSQATGGAYDPNAVAASRMANLGAASSTLPKSAANMAGGVNSAKNPALTTAASAKPLNSGYASSSAFQLPNTEGLILGGS